MSQYEISDKFGAGGCVSIPSFRPVHITMISRVCNRSYRRFFKQFNSVNFSSTVRIDNTSFRAHIQSVSPADVHNTFATTTSSSNLLTASDTFAQRHLGSSSEADIAVMCKTIGVSSVDQLITETIPPHVIRDQTSDPLQMHADSVSESKSIEQLRDIASRNIVGTNFIGQGYYGTVTPSVILRNLLENPAWYTAYTPYQAEISQGRLEALFTFQTLVADLTGMEVANCSLLDEGSSAAEAMSMFARAANSPSRNVFFVSNTVHPQTIDVVKTRAEWMGIDCIVGDLASFDFSVSSTNLLGALVQYPDTTGRLVDYAPIASAVHAAKGKLCVAADPLALTVCTPPGQFGADAVVGTMQRFGVPMWYGGPHAGFLATSMGNVRRMPGRLIGQSVDAEGRTALRLTLQTREQHIRLDKATSNICTSQALLANMSAMYAVYHGPVGLQRIAARVHALAQLFASNMGGIGQVAEKTNFFDTVTVDVSPVRAEWVRETLNAQLGIQLRVTGASSIAVSFDETHTEADVAVLVEALEKCVIEYAGEVSGSPVVRDVTHIPSDSSVVDGMVPPLFRRTGGLLKHKIFNSIQTETEMMRYLYQLQLKDLSLTSSMITLGSCTMKLNSASSMVPCSWPEIANIHPFAPKENTKGYSQLLHELSAYLATITGFDVCSLQPTSGASGEYAGLLTIRKYLASVGEGDRNVVIIPKSAHGTNSASAAMMGMQIKWIDDSEGIDLAGLKQMCEANADSLAALMVTYPSTRGIFEDNIKEVCDLIHQYGGQVYMDGANMNAQLGLTSPGVIGADVCHLNLHKTFSIPHGGGGPGLGPICARAHLGPFLPGHCEERALPANGSVSSAPYGQAGIAAIPWMFITMLGARGLTESGRQAIVNANYMAARLRDHYPMPFLNKHGRCSHEFIIDVAGIKEQSGIAEEDIAKRLMDYGFHAPTMSWPVHASLMIEPTESENIAELDRFVEAMIAIRVEIKKIETGEWDRTNNPLKNAPHTQSMVCASEWKFPYSREQAAFPLDWIRGRGKFWPSVARVNNSEGDKKLILTLME